MMKKECVNCPGAVDHSTAECPLACAGQRNMEGESRSFEAWRNAQVESLRRMGYPEAADAFYNLGSVQWASWQARASLPVGVPDGWKLVPVEPTTEMRQAFYAELNSRGAWRAMLAAAPATQPAAELTNVRCQCCSLEYGHNSYDAGFIAGKGHCEACNEVMQPAAEQSAPGEVGRVEIIYDPDSRSYEEHTIPVSATKGSRKSLGIENAQLKSKIGRLCIQNNELRKEIDKHSSDLEAAYKAGLSDGSCAGLPVSWSVTKDGESILVRHDKGSAIELNRDGSLSERVIYGFLNDLLAARDAGEVRVPTLADLDRYRIELLPEHSAGYMAQAYIEESEPVAVAHGFTAEEAVREVIAIIRQKDADQ